MYLTEHFTLEELIHSNTALRLGIDNNPPPEVLENLQVLANNLEYIRKIFDCPLSVSSGYRSKELNRRIGGSRKSAHILGYAADIRCNKYTPKQMQDILVKKCVMLDQCIEEGTWLHLSFEPRARNQFLTATFKNGRVTYTSLKVERNNVTV